MFSFKGATLISIGILNSFENCAALALIGSSINFSQ